MTSPILELRQISRRFGPRFALEGIDLSLFPGEVHFITGENGSGKSALMQLVSGMYQPDSGTMVYQGREVCFADLSEARKQGIVYQQQDVELFGNLSVAENVYFNDQGLLLAIPRLELGERCGRLFREFGIDISPLAPLSSLGYAQKLLVAACATYLSRGRILIYDEPTAGMGDKERDVFFRIIARSREEGAGILYISHRLEEAARIGTRLSVLQQGRISGHMETADTDRSTIIRMMIGSTRPERYPRLPTTPGPVVLSVQGLAKAPALRDVSFTLRKGEILGVMGLMGSGRTRLAKCLCGEIQPDAGSMRLGSTEVSFRHPVEALMQGISMIPEDRTRNALFPRQDLLSNLVSASLGRFMTPLGLDLAYMNELSREYLDSFTIHPSQLASLIEHCSGGNQQKVVIARWLMSCARIFIMDEPTRGIDAATRVDIYNAMNDVVANGASIILISSDTEELMGMCDRIVVLANGMITSEHIRSGFSKEQLLHSANPT